jgi:hypothetical protein
MNRRAVALAGLTVVLVVGARFAVPAAAARAGLADRLTDQDFWALSEQFSEPGGTFHSDNFVSNEGRYQTVIPDLLTRAHQGGVYLGVGPEQNFTYIVALHPAMGFIVDIRRGNLHEHLLYKALIEMSADRADFLSRLFSRKRPAALTAQSTVEDLFGAYLKVAPSPTLYRENLAAVLDWLTKRHGFHLHDEDGPGIDYVYKTAFYTDGPNLGYALNGMRGGLVGSPNYADLMALDDGQGRQRSYLVSEEHFALMKTLESKNLLVPVVGDFAGPKALRAVGRYVKDHGGTVAAFYLSNVEQYLQQDGIWNRFCANVASMPIDASSTFIRSVRGGAGSARAAGGGAMPGVLFTSSLGEMLAETRSCGGAHEEKVP